MLTRILWSSSCCRTSVHTGHGTPRGEWRRSLSWRHSRCTERNRYLIDSQIALHGQLVSVQHNIFASDSEFRLILREKSLRNSIVTFPPASRTAVLLPRHTVSSPVLIARPLPCVLLAVQFRDQF